MNEKDFTDILLDNKVKYYIMIHETWYNFQHPTTFYYRTLLKIKHYNKIHYSAGNIEIKYYYNLNSKKKLSAKTLNVQSINREYF